MKIDYNTIDKFLAGKTDPKETLEVLAAIATDPDLEEYLVTKKRLDYSTEQMADYDSFIPASSMAADDGRNLCDLQCEAFILKSSGITVSEEDLSTESRRNYWLQSQGTPLFNIGKLLETKGFIANRVYNSDIHGIEEALKEYSVIAVVNGGALENDVPDIFSEDFSLENDPNHAVVVLAVSRENGIVTLYNPSKGECQSDYPIERFENAWNESRNYMVTVRPKKFKEEYNPQPIDVSEIDLNPELLELTEMIAENAHDVWAVGKKLRAEKDNKTLAYAPVDDDTDPKMRYNHFYVPYSMLSEDDKNPDREMALNTIKLIKRLGYRLININSMYKCPECGEVIEPSHNFCHNCGHPLSWTDFRG